MKQGMDEMLQFEKNPERTEKVYTYEKAVERYHTFSFNGVFKKEHPLIQ